MRDHSSKYSHSSATKTAVETSDRRGSARTQFTATAEVTELGSGAKFSARTTDLGPGGCFVDTMLPFPVGSDVSVILHKGKNKFETGGSVVYSQTGLGMGIAFGELTPDRRVALDDWLGEVTAEKRAGFEVHPPSPKSGPVRGPDHAILVRMIHLLVSKGILTEAEGAALLHDPVL